MSLGFNWTIIRNALLDLVFPPHCVVCGRNGEWLCAECAASFRRVHLPISSRSGRQLAGGSHYNECIHHATALDGIRAAAYYEGGVRTCIHHLKYKGSRVLAPYLAEIMANSWSQAPVPSSTIVPVPLHPQRVRQRGYNQAALLAQELGRRLKVPIIADCLIRVKHTRPQVGLDAKERRLNVRDAFACIDHRLSGKNILLVDDVCTTGATLEACAHALRQQESSSVWALVLARERSQ